MIEKVISQRLSKARENILKEYPFFGRLLLHLKFGLAPCKTAFTDMRHIVFDPDFANRLSDDEVKYVLLHEVLHCSLKHCTRGKGKQRFLYNVACDIVVNSILLEMFGVEEILIDGQALMHMAPDGAEGRTKTEDEIYYMLKKMPPTEFDEKCDWSEMDTHIPWEEINDSRLEDAWGNYVKKAAVVCGIESGIPGCLERHLKEIVHSPKVNWRQILHDFIQFDRHDYSFWIPDKRYSSDILLPSFCENLDGSKVDKLWFLVDTSGSISDETLAVVYEEIKQAMEQVGHISGKLSFFDVEVSEPVAFETFEDILTMKPIGCGGTSFEAIFKKLEEFEDDDIPSAIVIMTDGYATFPPEESALGIPVIWIIVDSAVKPPWGVYAYVG